LFTSCSIIDSTPDWSISQSGFWSAFLVEYLADPAGLYSGIGARHLDHRHSLIIITSSIEVGFRAAEFATRYNHSQILQIHLKPISPLANNILPFRKSRASEESQKICYIELSRMLRLSFTPFRMAY
jgi:hypothetical protein